MKVKNIVDEFGFKSQIDENTKGLYDYDNDSHIIIYNAQTVKNGERTGIWTNYAESGTVESIEERLKKWNNKVLFLYSVTVGFNAPKNDPEKEKYKKIVDFVKENPEKFFTESGNFREKFITKTGDFYEGLTIEDEKFKNLIKNLIK